MDALATQMQAAYNAIAATYEQHNSGPMPRNLNVLAYNVVQQLGDNPRILDLGCGVGRDMAWFEQQNMRVTGLDLSPDMLAFARRRTKGPLLSGDMRSLPFPTGYFDAVWCCAALLHIPKADVPGVLQEIQRVLHHDGLLMVSIQAGTGEQWDGGYVEGVTRFFARYQSAEFQQLLADGGFTTLEQEHTSTGTREWLAFLCQINDS